MVMMKKGQHSAKYFTTRTYALEKMSEELGVSKAAVSKYISECELYAPFDDVKYQLIRDHYKFIRDNEHKNRSEATSAAAKGSNNPFYGKRHSDETKKKISEAKKGIPSPMKGKEGRKHTVEEKEAQSVRSKEWHSKHRGNLLEVCQKTGYSPSYCLQHFEHTIIKGKAHFDVDNINAKKTGKPHSSFEEKEIVNFIKSIYSGVIIENDRSVIAPKELDIYIPEKKVAIEYNGLFWHSEAMNGDRFYHYNKTTGCEKVGVRLIQIYQDEWHYKQDIVKSIISSALGIYEHKVSARLTAFREVPKKEGREFFDKNHIKGDCNAFRYVGLYSISNGELLMCASFRKTFTNTEKHIELARMATLLNTQVVGGFSKLLVHSDYDRIESFVDRRLFNANGYSSVGWFWLAPSLPGYSYTDFDKRYGRQTFMKQSCLKKWPESDPNKSEKDLCMEHGLYRIWDSGNYKLYWKKC